jgi:hypothetical protein
MHPNFVSSQFEDADEGTPESQWLGGVVSKREVFPQHVMVKSRSVVHMPTQLFHGPLAYKDTPTVISAENLHEEFIQRAPALCPQAKPVSVTVGKSSVSDDSSVDSGNSSHHLHFAIPPGVQPNDVLCGRGKGANNFVGNRRFREHVMAFREIYATTPRRAEKRAICKQIIDSIYARGGRFLIRNESAPCDDHMGGWTELEEDKVLVKVSQALREGVAKWNKVTQKYQENQAKLAALASPNPAMALLAEISCICPSLNA